MLSARKEVRHEARAGRVIDGVRQGRERKDGPKTGVIRRGKALEFLMTKTLRRM